MTTVERRPWERLDNETSRAYAAFRHYRDLGLQRRVDAVPVTCTLRTVERWYSHYDWPARVRAWDDEIHRLDDAERLEAIRTMHANHQRAGRAALRKGLQALEQLDPTEIGAGQVARLLELGARLERQILLTSVEDLQGLPDEAMLVINGNDAWERIARELTGT